MGSALADRFLHVRLEPSADGWIAWAMENDIHPWVITFIKTKPEYLNSCGGQDSSDHLVKPTPRSWKNVSEVLQVTDNDDEVRSIMINGLVGEASTVVFKHVVEELAGLPTMERLLKMQPREIGRAIPANISALYGLTYSLTAFVNKIEDMERAIMIFDEVAAVQDALPRAEIQAIGMEMLLDKAYRHNLLNSLIGSKTYKSRYAAKAMELAS
jgi:hypothetical protein